MNHAERYEYLVNKMAAIRGREGEKVFEIDDSAGKRREAFNLQMEQMMEAPGMEPD